MKISPLLTRGLILGAVWLFLSHCCRQVAAQRCYCVREELQHLVCLSASQCSRRSQTKTRQFQLKADPQQHDADRARDGQAQDLCPIAASCWTPRYLLWSYVIV